MVGELGWGWTEHWTGEQNGARGRRAGGAGRAGVTDSDARSVGTSIEATGHRHQEKPDLMSTSAAGTKQDKGESMDLSSTGTAA